MILAKSKSNITLENHSEQVEDVAEQIAKLSDPNISKTTLDKIKKAAYLHDIGKAETGFQNYIQHGIESKGIFFNHQEVGWAFLKGYTDLDENILNAVYWHHAVSRPNFKYDKRENVATILKDIDISSMKEFYENKYGKGKIAKRTTKAKIPLYYDPEKEDHEFSELLFIRNCLISADRIVSKNIAKKDLTNSIESILNRRLFHINVCPFTDSKRFDVQKEIISKCDKNTLIKAPAGFGKTLLGLMWAALSNKKLIWVCPRNTVAESVYMSIIKELELTNNRHVSVELYLTGETKKSNSDKTDFTSDIIVTNIDNFERPNCDIANSDKLYLVNNCDIVFDEFHELPSEAALYKIFVLLNNMRGQYCPKARSLFLSATPSLMLDNLKMNIKTLPSRNSHYSSVHSKLYNLEVKDVEDIDFIKKRKSTLFVFNSIQNAQEAWRRGSMIFHSKYTDQDREDIFNKIFDEYNEASPRSSYKINIYATHIIQASLNISVKDINESILSPESTLQRIGRCDRWGDYRLPSNITCFKEKNISNQKSISILYNTTLNKKWIDYLEKIQGQITLDELYEHYNNFNNIYKDSIYRYYDEVENRSNENIAQIYPIKYRGVRQEEILDANSGKLRKTGDSIFYTVKELNSNNWVGPFTEEVYNKDKIDKQFKEDYNTIHKIKKIQLYLSKQGQFEYGNQYAIGKRTLDDIRRRSVKSNFPYPRFDLKYDKDKGVIKVK